MVRLLLGRLVLLLRLVPEVLLLLLLLLLVLRLVLVQPEVLLVLPEVLLVLPEVLLVLVRRCNLSPFATPGRRLARPHTDRRASGGPAPREARRGEGQQPVAL